MNATPEERADARAVMMDRASMTALVEAARSGKDLDAHECMRLIIEEYNAGAPCVDITTGETVYAKAKRR